MDVPISSILLHDGNRMPMFGLGCWAMFGQESYNATLSAINSGYRLLDTAQFYDNENMIGKAVRDSGLPRDDLFIVTKLDPSNHGFESTKLNLKRSLDQLGLEYVDLFLIHSPHGLRNIETWRALMELKEAGFTKSIGVSNFNIHHIEALVASGLEVPAVNQIELHPWNQYVETVEYCRQKNIAVMGYCPLARCQFFGTSKCAVIDNLANKYKKTKAQILLKWAIQSEFITIPKSSNCERIKENISIFGWSISNDDMRDINNLNEERVVGAWNTHMRSKWQG